MSIFSKPANEISIVIITGLSGAGRSHTSNVFEDLGYFVIDNAPPQIIPSLVQIVRTPGSQITKLALVADVRSGEYFARLNSVIKEIKASGINIKLLFLESSDQTLVKRYESSRRPHPLQGNGTIIDGIKKEREILSKLKLTSDYLIDTSSTSIHDLSRQINNIFASIEENEIKVHIMSFGFKYGLPLDANFVADVRFLPNPFWIEELREKTGRDNSVYEYVINSEGALDFCEAYSKIILSTLSKFIHENKKYLTIAIGCTGGRHRSVSISRKLEELLLLENVNVTLSARDIEK